MRKPPMPPMNLPDVVIETPKGNIKFLVLADNKIRGHFGKDTGWFHHNGVEYYVIGPFCKNFEGKPGWSLNQKNRHEFAVYAVPVIAENKVTDPEILAVAVAALESAFALYMAQEPHLELKIAHFNAQWEDYKAFEDFQEANKAVIKGKAEILRTREKKNNIAKELRKAIRASAAS